MKSEFSCACCAAETPIGASMVTVGHQIERFDGVAIDVSDAYAVAIWCMGCAASMEAVQEAMHRLVPADSSERSRS